MAARRARTHRAAGGGRAIDGRSVRPARDRPRAVDDRAIARRVAGLAERGVVTRQGLRAFMTEAQIDQWVRRGRLHGVFSGVYLVGHAGELHAARELAAARATGLDVAAQSAAWVYGFGKQRPREVELLTTGGTRRGPKGTRVRSTTRLGEDERGDFEGIPVTAPARTIADCAALVGAAELESMIKRAEFRRLVTQRELEPYTAWRRPGAPLLRDVLQVGPAETLSRAERRLVELIRRSALPMPSVNQRGRHGVPDLHWPEARLVVEIDGAQHWTDVARAADVRRDAALLLRDTVTLRVPATDVLRHPTRTITQIAMVYAVRRHVVGTWATRR